jgi:dihydrofolate reductase
MATLVVAIAKNRVIGLNNQMPWHLPEDLQHFKKTTFGHTLLMGRKTFESIGKALPGRRTIVLTRDASWQHEGCESANSIAQAIELAKTTPERHPFVVGGANVYQQAIEGGYIDKMIVTKIAIEPAGDAFFPEISGTTWSEVNRESFQSKTGLAYSISHFQPVA